MDYREREDGRKGIVDASNQSKPRFYEKDGYGAKTTAVRFPCDQRE